MTGVHIFVLILLTRYTKLALSSYNNTLWVGGNKVFQWEVVPISNKNCI